MRTDPAVFAAANRSKAKNPRTIIQIDFPGLTISFTSHAGISGVTGTVFENTVRASSVYSQRINPLEGRTEIGAGSFQLVDRQGLITTAIRQRLESDAGLRGRTVRFFRGYEGLAFAQFATSQTQIVRSVSYENGVYSISCSDVLRSARKNVFSLAETTLTASITATDTTIAVASTLGFERLAHDATWSDAPSQTVGYFRIPNTNEIVRYTGTTSTQFTGCTRGALGTVARPVTVDAALPVERRERVSEYVFLEGPVPKLIYAMLTGVMHAGPGNLPSRWHLAIPTTLVRLADFTGIGADLWNTAAEGNQFRASFEGLTETDGKQFLEKELYSLIGCYPVVYSDGQLGLRRRVPVLRTAATVLTLSDDNLVAVGDLEHDMPDLCNTIAIDWNYVSGKPTRTTIFTDPYSQSVHGVSDPRRLQFRGVRGSIHTDAVLLSRADAYHDAYSAPPQRLTVDVLPSLNVIEPGDMVRVVTDKVRDFAGAAVSIDRAFEVQHVAEDFESGRLTLDLFGSTAPSVGFAPTAAATVLPDGYYNAAGTNLAGILSPILNGSFWEVQPGLYTITGGADLNATGSIFYFVGNLRILPGATIRVEQNVQLRVRGFFENLGTIDGIGRGRPGVADNGTITAQGGTPGFIGASRGYDGINVTFRNGAPVMESLSAGLAVGAYSVAPRLDLRVDGSTLLGLPTDIRGTSGGPGGKIGFLGSPWTPTATPSGTGGASGAGLALICRGFAAGVASSINLSGAPGLQPAAPATWVDNTFFPGAGAGGSPGAFYLLLDGAALSWPDLEGRFVANMGASPIPGANRFLTQPALAQYPRGNSESPNLTYGGFDDPSRPRAGDLSLAALRIQYVPESVTPVGDADTKPPPLQSLTANAGAAYIQLLAGLASFDLFDLVEFWVSTTNNRAAATLAGVGRVSEWRYVSTPLETRYFWGRTRRTVDGRVVVSDWFPSSATAGVAQAATDVGTGPQGPAGPAGPAGTNGTNGTNGAPALAVVLSSSALTFRYDRDNQPAPGGQVITLTAFRLNIASAATWTTTPTVTLGGTGDVRTLAIADFGANNSVRIRATADGYFDEVTVVRVRDGAEALLGYLTNEAHVVPANSSGVVSSYAGAGGTFVVFYGSEDVTDECTFSVVSNPQGLTISGPAAGTGAYSITGGLDAGEPGATIAFRATRGALTVDRVFTLGKAVAGATGPTGPTGATGAPLFALVLNGVNQVGNVLTKGAVADGWNASAHSTQGYRNCFVSARPGVASRAVMFGLNADPATDSGFTSIDFAWYATQINDLRIYENGFEILSAGSYTTLTALAITYDGRRLTYWKDGVAVRTVARPGLTLYFDSSFFDNSIASLADVAFGPQGPAAPPSGNMLDVDQWLIGTTVATQIGNFIASDSVTGESAIVLAGQGTAPLGPYGTGEPLWECRPDAGGSASGGFVNAGDIFALDPKRAYRVRAWFYMNATAQAEGGAAALYLGCGTSGETRDLGGGVNSNPYVAIAATNQLEANRWYLFIGVIFGEDYSGGQSGVSGVYDPRTGRLVETVTARADYRMAVGATTQSIRAFPYYFTNTASRIWISRPAFELMDGREPTVASLLIAPDSDNTDRQRIIPDVEVDDSAAWQLFGPTFSPTGGTVGGYLEFAGAGDAIPRRERGLRVVAGRQWVKVTVRTMRRAGTPTLTVELMNCNKRNIATWPTGADTGAGVAVQFGVGLQAVDAWVESTQYVKLDYANASFPYLFVGLRTNGGTLRVDYIDVEPTAAPGSQAGGVPSSSSSITLADADIGVVRQYDSTSPGTFTVPPDSSIDAPVSSLIGFLQRNTGTLSIAAGAGVTLLSPPNRTDTRSLSGRYARAAIIKLAPNTWSLDGSLAP